MIDNNHEKTFVVKMAIYGNKENELLRFLSIIIDDENQSLSFDNFIAIPPESMMVVHNPILYLLEWRLKNWGVAHDCGEISKNVRNTEYLFHTKKHRYVEYLQYTCLFNVPIKFFLEVSKHFSNLIFEMVFMRNDLNVCGKVKMENGEIIEKNVINQIDQNVIDTFFIASYIYDENYTNAGFSKILETLAVFR